MLREALLELAELTRAILLGSPELGLEMTRGAYNGISLGLNETYTRIYPASADLRRRKDGH